MKIAKKEFWGTVLIIAGVAIFTFVIYDSVRPFFPDSEHDPIAKKIIGLFSPSHKSTGLRRAPAPPSVPVSRVVPPGMLTGNTYRTHGDYYLWIWGVKPERKTGDKVTIKIAHPIAGDMGAFQIVAAADTNGDGKPDREIARSKMLSAKEPRSYSSFTFTTREKAIFVGNTWPGKKNVLIYRGGGPWPLPQSPFQNRFYLKIGDENNLMAGPAFTNMTISFSD